MSNLGHLFCYASAPDPERNRCAPPMPRPTRTLWCGSAFPRSLVKPGRTRSRTSRSRSENVRSVRPSPATNHLTTPRVDSGRDAVLDAGSVEQVAVQPLRDRRRRSMASERRNGGRPRAACASRSGCPATRQRLSRRRRAARPRRGRPRGGRRRLRARRGPMSARLRGRARRAPAAPGVTRRPSGLRRAPGRTRGRHPRLCRRRAWSAQTPTPPGGSAVVAAAASSHPPVLAS
jgi:hypothetical protein